MQKEPSPLFDIEKMIERLKNEKMDVQPHFYGVITVTQWRELVKKEKDIKDSGEGKMNGIWWWK